MALTKAWSPDEWRGILQFVVDSAPPMARDLFIGLLGAWIYDHLPARREATPPQSSNAEPQVNVTTDIRIFIGPDEVKAEDRQGVEDLVAKNLAAGRPRIVLPPGLVRETVDTSEISEAEWIKHQSGLSQQYHAEVARRIEESERD